MTLWKQGLMARLQDATTDAGDAGGGAAAAAAGGDKGAAKTDPSLLSQGGDAGAQAAAAATAATDAAAAAATAKLKADPLAWLPEKFRVKGEGDVLNLEESGKKVAGAYAELEKRMKDTGLPPESADAYEYKPAKGFEALELDADKMKQAKAACHALGLSPKQFQGVMDQYVASLNDTIERGTVIGAEKAKESLAKVWGPADQPKFTAQLGLAHKAFKAFADPEDAAEIDRIGNFPVVLKILAKVGRELAEDRGVGGDAILSKESLETLMKDPAYFNGAHPRHAEVKAKVMKHFEAQAAEAARRAATG